MLGGMLAIRLGGVTGVGTGSAGLFGRSRAADLTGLSGPDTILVSENRVGSLGFRYEGVGEGDLRGGRKASGGAGGKGAPTRALTREENPAEPA